MSPCSATVIARELMRKLEARTATSASRRHLLQRALLGLAHVVSALLPPTRGLGLRKAVFRLAGLQIAEGVQIVGGARFHYANVAIGEGTWVGTETHFFCNVNSWIRIGARVDIAPGCFFNTGSHRLGGPEERAGRNYAESISIGDGTWIGMGVKLLDGTQVGKGCVIAAGAVVRGRFPDDVLIGGVPAKVIKQLDEAGEVL